MNLRNRVWLWAAILLVAGGIAALWRGGIQLLRPEVVIAAVERGEAVQAAPGIIRVDAERTVDLRAEVGGRLLESHLSMAARFKAGDVVARMDDAESRRAIERVKIDLEAEEALAEIGSLLRYDLEEAREELARMEYLYPTGRFSSRDIDAQKRLVARLVDESRMEEINNRRRLSLLRNELRRLETEIEKMVIRAPVSGDVVEIFAHPGDIVGQRGPVARLLSAGRVIEASLSEEDFAGVMVGQPATVRFLAYGSRLFPARVARLMPSADPQTQRYTVHLDVEMPEELMVPGITGEVSIVVAARDDALIIPRRALLGREVFVIRDGLAELRPIELGFIGLNSVEVLAGLRYGDWVAVENLDRIRDGDRVRVRR